ncbi:MATE family efflux transporter [Mycoplasma miroungirhinis]|uniref:MATE efflux family protein n=1 Tax=Mycoplasma miroungirhinis TaxID=754516 RepID=A0A6M4JDA9_9MOLU|nr:MATE family efflux transporter [Mycoplasma miroungirhinis]QJR44238.1 hypothetical protein HLA92_02210 [Mycoplasma miroungirhinis]
MNLKLKQKLEINNWKEFWVPKDMKMILKLTFPIFIQILINVIATIVGSLSVNWYLKVTHESGQVVGTYFYALAKVILVYNLISFIPTLVSSGVLIICSNLIGQNRHHELPKIIWTGVYVNLIIALVFFISMWFASPLLLAAMGSKSSIIIYGQNHQILHNNELEFTTKYLRYMLFWLFFYSIAQVFAAGLQAIKKNNIAVMGAIIGNFCAVVWMYVLLYGYSQYNPIYLTAFDYTLGAIIQLLINYIFCHFFIFKKYKTKIKDTFKWDYVKKTLVLGTPISLEYGVWTISQFLISSAISTGGLGDQYIGMYRAIIMITGITTAFNTALGAVTNVLIGIEIGKDDKKRAYNLAWQLFVIGLYFSLLSGAILISLTYPLLKLYQMDTAIINKIGYWIMFFSVLKIIVDTANLTILRALWSANDIWITILISLITMMVIQVSLVHIILDLWYKNNSASITAPLVFSVVFLSLIADPGLRSIIYIKRWINKTWHKYAKKF